MRAHASFSTAALLALLVAGCTSTTPEWDRQFGQSVRTAKAQQSRNAAPVSAAPDGMDGKAADATMRRYRQTPAVRQAETAPEQR